MTVKAETVVSMGSRAAPAAHGKALPAIVPFFLLGLFSGFIGTAWFGVHLWLMLNGEMTIPGNYMALKSAHALLQIHLFLGMFIAGFTLHSGPHLLKTRQAPPKWGPWLALLPACAALILFVDPYGMYARGMLGASFLIISLNFARLMAKAEMEKNLSIGIPLLISNLVLGVSVFSALDAPLVSVHVLWHGVGLAIFASGQQFIAGFMGGRHLSKREGGIFLTIVLTSAACSILAVFYPARQADWLRCFALADVVMLAYYARHTKMLLRPRITNSPVALGFTLANGWAFIGALVLLTEPLRADFALHVWATGWAVTLVIATSTNILSFLSGRHVSPRLMLWLLISWQAVPVGRGLGYFEMFRGQTSMLTGLIAGVVMTTWCFLLLRRGAAVFRASLEHLRS